MEGEKIRKLSNHIYPVYYIEGITSEEVSLYIIWLFRERIEMNHEKIPDEFSSIPVTID